MSVTHNSVRFTRSSWPSPSVKLDCKNTDPETGRLGNWKGINVWGIKPKYMGNEKQTNKTSKFCKGDRKLK